jgi:hypothetical protein
MRVVHISVGAGSPHPPRFGSWSVITRNDASPTIPVRFSDRGIGSASGATATKPRRQGGGLCPIYTEPQFDSAIDRVVDGDTVAVTINPTRRGYGCASGTSRSPTTAVTSPSPLG